MTVWDKNLNGDFCNVFLTFGGEVGDCDPNDGSRSLTLRGHVETPIGSRLEGIEVGLQISNGETRTTVSDEDGIFYFEGVPSLSTVAYGGQINTNDFDNGVSTLDLVLIQRHILSLAPFTSPYKMVAADVNGSETITGADVVELRRLILGVTDAFSNSSWKLSSELEVDGNFPQVNAYPTITLSDQDVMDLVLKGIKIGDVNHSAEVLENRSSTSIGFSIQDQDVKAGELVEVVVNSENYENLFGYQFTLNTSGLELVDVLSGELNMAMENIGVIDAETLTVSYASSEAETASNLFTLVMRAKQSGNVLDMISMTSSITMAESYVEAGDEIAVANIKLVDPRDALNYALDQNEPNPFKDQTVIGWTMGKDAEATLTVYDVQGRVIYSLTGDYTKGDHTISLDREELQGVSGVLYYQLESGDFTATKKMILMD